LGGVKPALQVSVLIAASVLMLNRERHDEPGGDERPESEFHFSGSHKL
jgi:hypothetical protein